MIMASVTLAAIKIGGVMLGLSPLQTILVAGGGHRRLLACSAGLTGVLVTDFVLFIVAMVGSIAGGGLWRSTAGGRRTARSCSRIRTSPSRLDFLPDFSNTDVAARRVFIIPLAVQWWSVWYPGSEPGGGGYVAQRMLAAKNEGHAQGATLLFNVAHYALRPWPWILVALRLADRLPRPRLARRRVPATSTAQVVRHDLAYPAMLTFLPAGLLGLVVASLAAAYMSTISTHLNWGSSYLVNDFYRRFVNPAASERELVRVGRSATLVLMAAAWALVAAASERPAGVPDPAPDRRRHRAALHPALVLVADQRGERDRRRWSSRSSSRSTSSSVHATASAAAARRAWKQMVDRGRDHHRGVGGGGLSRDRETDDETLRRFCARDASRRPGLERACAARPPPRARSCRRGSASCRSASPARRSAASPSMSALFATGAVIYGADGSAGAGARRRRRARHPRR